jgi:hypothetical protein
MSNLPASRAESAGVLIAPEVLGQLGVAPAAGWRTMQPDQDQINDFYRDIKTVQPSPISVERQEQAPIIVDADAMPKLGMDLTRDLVNQVGEGIVLAKARHSGGTGQSLFVPTARTAAAYTVAAAGALQSRTLVHADGWLNPANNGLFLVGPASANNAIDVAGGVAETPVGYLATVEVAGYRGQPGAIGLDVNGHLTSDGTVDFTTLGLTPGQFVYVSGVPGSAFAFANAGYNGFAQVSATQPITPALLPLRRRAWTVGPADPGAGKTIDLYFCRWLRNVSTVHPDYQEQAYHLELSMSSIGPAGATEYVYAQGQMIGTFGVNAASASLVKATLSLIGTDVTDPSVNRAGGAAAAPVPLLTDRFTPVNEPYLSVTNAATEASVCTDVTSWSLTFANGITGQKQHGKIGPKRLVVGKVHAELTLEIVVTQDDAIKACSANTTLSFGAGLRNTNGGVFFDVPSLKLTGAVPKFPANGVVTLSPKGGPFIDAVGRYTFGMSVFSYLPAA